MVLFSSHRFRGYLMKFRSSDARRAVVGRHARRLQVLPMGDLRNNMRARRCRAILRSVNSEKVC